MFQFIGGVVLHLVPNPQLKTTKNALKIGDLNTIGFQNIFLTWVKFAFSQLDDRSAMVQKSPISSILLVDTVFRQGAMPDAK